MRINRSVEKLAKIPVFWNIFESIFGADEAKKTLYRSVFKKTCRIMDFGCATGNTTSAFKDFDYVGIDIDSESIKWAKKKWKKSKNIKFIKADITGKKIKIPKFDSILFASTGHHLDDNKLIRILKKLSTYLKPRGKMYYFDTIKPGKNSHLLTKWLCSIDRGIYMRNIKDFNKIFETVSDIYRVKTKKIYGVTGTLLPQPKYLFMLLQKK